MLLLLLIFSSALAFSVGLGVGVSGKRLAVKSARKQALGVVNAARELVYGPSINPLPLEYQIGHDLLRSALSDYEQKAIDK